MEDFGLEAKMCELFKRRRLEMGMGEQEQREAWFPHIHFHGKLCVNEARGVLICAIPQRLQQT